MRTPLLELPTWHCGCSSGGPCAEPMHGPWAKIAARSDPAIERGHEAVVEPQKSGGNACWLVHFNCS